MVKYAYICMGCSYDSPDRNMTCKVKAEAHFEATGHPIAYVNLVFGAV